MSVSGERQNLNPSYRVGKIFFLLDPKVTCYHFQPLQSDPRRYLANLANLYLLYNINVLLFKSTVIPVSFQQTELSFSFIYVVTIVLEKKIYPGMDKLVGP